MLLAIDIGNTDTKLGYFPRGTNGDVGALAKTWRLTTARRRTSDEFGVLVAAMFRRSEIPPESVEAIVIASVVPQLDRVLREACLRYFGTEPSFFTSASQKLIAVRTDRPSEVGADLVAGAIGAVASHGAPAIVVGFGTATTFSAVSSAGEFLGVAIAPGIQISIDALVERTAKLPQVALEAPPSVIGRETVSALQSGIIYGFVAQTEGVVARMQRELGGRARVVAYGGLAEMVAKHTSVIEAVDKNLILDGLRLHYSASR